MDIFNIGMTVGYEGPGDYSAEAFAGHLADLIREHFGPDTIVSIQATRRRGVRLAGSPPPPGWPTPEEIDEGHFPPKR